MAGQPSSAPILIIEDDPNFGRLLVRTLQRKGFDTSWFLTGREGLAAARARQPAVILLDIKLPDTDGFRVCQQLSLDEATRGIPVIMMTGLLEAAAPLETAARALGGIDFFEKGSEYRVDALLGMIERALRTPRKALRGSWTILERGRIRVDVVRRKAWVRDAPLTALGPRRFDLLCELLGSEAGLSRGDLQKHVWQGDGGDRTVDRTISRLRDDLRSAGAEDAVVTTIDGYRLVG